MIKVFPDSETLSRYSADLFAKAGREAVKKHGRFVVALSGGSSPTRTYELLGSEEYRKQVPWQAAHIFWGDERCVPIEDPASNAGKAIKIWLDKVPIPESHIHPIDGSAKPDEAARKYDEEIRSFFGDPLPVFDLVFLGLGANGHTASLFPETPVLDERERVAAEVYVAEQSMFRVTLTVPVINRANLVVFIVFGGKKAGIVHDVLEGPSQPHRLPAQLIRNGEDRVCWLLDEAAASLIEESEYETIR